MMTLLPTGATVVLVGNRDKKFERLASLLEEQHYRIVYRTFASQNDARPTDTEASLYVLSYDAGAEVARYSNGEPSRKHDETVRRHSAPRRRGVGSQSGERSFVHFIEHLTKASPHAAILVAVDEPEPLLVEKALEAGAHEILSAREFASDVLAWTRVQSAVAHAKLTGRGEVATLMDLLQVAAPGLRAGSGRLDAKKVADRLGVSVARIASLTPVTRQALNETPDSSRVQEALDPIARSLAVLETALAPEHVNQWLNASHSRLNGSTPLEALLDGRAERVARMLEIARDGGVN